MYIRELTKILHYIWNLQKKNQCELLSKLREVLFSFNIVAYFSFFSSVFIRVLLRVFIKN